MCSIKTIDKNYKTDTDVYNVCKYVLNLLKTCEDNFRGLDKLDVYSNMSYMGPQLLPEVCAEMIANEIIVQNYISRNDGVTQLYHRVISFDQYDLVNGDDLKSLAEYIMKTVYGNYTWAYGVHMDTKCIHLHILVSAVSRDWKRFSISNEWRWLYEICTRWYEAHSDYVEYTKRDDRVYKNLW